MVTPVSAAARVFDFLGEPEVVFGLWTVPLFFTIELFYDRATATAYINDGVNFTEAVFVVVIMTIASTRPILELAESAMRQLARLGGESPLAWWMVLLTVGSALGSFITEPAAMTICASLLARKVDAFKPSKPLAHSTLGILIATLGYYFYFRRELRGLGRAALLQEPEESSELPIPVWVTVGHVLFMFSTVANAHHPKQLIFTMLFFLAFVEVTEDFQRNFSLRPAVLVGFFLAGLVIHGGLQQWWIAPVLGGLDELPLALGATALTAFNDNAAVTYLCTLVPSMTEGMK